MLLDGILYALGFIAAGLVASFVTKPELGIPFYILAVFCLWFFRNPNRSIPGGRVAVSPADGKIVSIRPMDGRTRVSIFLNVFDVHVNRSPIAGQVTRVAYQTGKFLVASKEEASTENEMNTIAVRGEDGVEIEFKQITGLIARRIICWKKQGDQVAAGERVGYIKFGSRVDIFFGPEWELAVQEGQRLRGGSSIMAKRK